MRADVPLTLRTIYAELLERARATAFSGAFPEDGVFVVKRIRGRNYWYFQASTANGRGQKYVGQEAPELLEQIETHKTARTYHRDRRSLVAMLVRVGNVPAPRQDIGELIDVLAGAGVFRLRGVLIGTVAYQTYPAMLGVRLPAALIQTDDVDVAQFTNVSAAMGDATRPMSEILRDIDPSFRPLPHIDPARTVSYMSASGLRVEFLTPNRGGNSEEPRNLPALGTDAQQLRFLDFLIRDPEPAVLLHGAGVLVSVPAPERFAVHKLIVARRRRGEDGKRQKDLMQAASLLEVLADRRPHELRAAWAEAFNRGKQWRSLMGEGLGLLHPATRDRALRAVGANRSVVPDLDLRFVPGRASYDQASDAVRFFALVTGPFVPASQETVACCVTREALSLAAGIAGLSPADCLDVFRDHRRLIEQAIRTKYLTEPVDAMNEVWLTG